MMENGAGKEFTEPVMCVGTRRGEIIPNRRENKFGVGVNRKQLKQIVFPLLFSTS